MDAGIGRITGALEKTGKLSETLIFFTSDNGGQQEYHSEVDYGGKHGPNPVLGDNRPLRGWKTDLYEGGVRVPAFVYWRDRLKPKVLQAPVSYLDWRPTLAHLASARVSDQWKLEGRNVWSLLSGQGAEPPAPTLYWNVGDSAAVLQENWKLIVRQQDPNAAELYDLARDAVEKTNLAAKESGKVEQLRGVLAAQRTLDP
jgi:arylsulfatase A-like enzyme